MIFELRNGKAIRPKILQKEDDVWSEVSVLEERIANKTNGKLYDKERTRRINVIIRILEADSIKGKFYLMKQFAQKYQNYKGLGGRRAIYDDCSVAATQGIIKFFDNPEEYEINLSTKNASFGFMCSENMCMETIKVLNRETNEITKNYIKILLTHYKDECDGRKTAMINSEIWNIDFEKNDIKICSS